MNWMNLDLKAAETAAALAKKATGLTKSEAEKINQQAASVLAHQGLSAFFLHLKVNKKPWAREIASQSYELLRTAWPEVLDPSKGSPLDEIAPFGQELGRLIEGKQLVDQMLIYLRYHTKTLPGTD